MKKYKEYIRFIFIFLIIYSILSYLFLKLIGNLLINFEKNIIYAILPNVTVSKNLIFVPECSGILTIALVLALILTHTITKNTYSTKYNINEKQGVDQLRLKRIKRVIYYILTLFILNIIRIILIILFEKINFQLAQIMHVVLWFLFGIIVYFMFIDYIKIKKE